MFFNFSSDKSGKTGPVDFKVLVSSMVGRCWNYKRRNRVRERILRTIDDPCGPHAANRTVSPSVTLVHSTHHPHETIQYNMRIIRGLWYCFIAWLHDSRTTGSNAKSTRVMNEIAKPPETLNNSRWLETSSVSQTFPHLRQTCDGRGSFLLIVGPWCWLMSDCFYS